jgi:hypothetical protein
MAIFGSRVDQRKDNWNFREELLGVNLTLLFADANP